MTANDSKSMQKVATKFCCETCDYKCNKKSDYQKHLNTAKHKMIVNAINFDKKLAQKTPEHFGCICGKVYAQKTNMYRHRKTCSVAN